MNASRAQARLSDVHRQVGGVVHIKCDKRAYTRKQNYCSTSLSDFEGDYTPHARKHICRTSPEVSA
mgnify:CR=1 FL=1